MLNSADSAGAISQRREIARLGFLPPGKGSIVFNQAIFVHNDCSSACSYSDPVHIITVYEPNIKEWKDGFRTKRKV